MFTFGQGISFSTRMSIMQFCTWIMHCHLVLRQCEISCLFRLELVELDRNKLRFKVDWSKMKGYNTSRLLRRLSACDAARDSARDAASITDSK